MFILLMAFIIWAFKECKTQINSEEQNPTEIPAIPKETTSDSMSAQSPVVSRIDTVKIVEKQAILYVNINGLKLRSQPNLKSEVLDQLAENQEVIFMGEVTEERDTISLGEITVIEPWVKIKTWKGKEGWVFGAGVDFYKKKMNGVY